VNDAAQNSKDAGFQEKSPSIIRSSVAIRKCTLAERDE